jgi:hypothetical protein
VSEDGQHRRSLNTYRGTVGVVSEIGLNRALDPHGMTIRWYLCDGPWHPLWYQFILGCVHLRPVEGMPPAKLHFEGATHEVHVIALNPDYGPYTVERMYAKGLTPEVPGKSLMLTPIDVTEQVVATDAEMHELVGLLAMGVADGMLNPSTDDARETLRGHWRRSIQHTLAHMRGEEHTP